MGVLEDFEALTVAHVSEYISRGQEEHLSLEFKRLAAPDFSAQSDKDNLARCLSGFANAVGGLVIWGVSTQKTAGGKAEVAAGPSEILDLTLAVARLNEFTGALVSPLVDGVRHKKLETKENCGFVGTLVPPSDSGPHMALAGVHGYYKRNGDRFLPMEHFEVADMFGRRRRPLLQVVYEISRGPSAGDFAEAHVDLFVANDGRGSAYAPYIDVQAEPGPQTTIKPRGIAGDLGLMQALSVPPRNAFLGRTDLVIHPGIRFHFARVAWRVQLNVPNPQWNDIRILCRVAADGAMLAEQVISIRRTEIAKMLGFDPSALFPSG